MHKYTVTISKADARYKSGWRLHSEDSGVELTEEQADDLRSKSNEDVLVEVAKWVERTNLMSGKKYWECPKTPLCCSPASDTYWSM